MGRALLGPFDASLPPVTHGSFVVSPASLCPPAATTDSLPEAIYSLGSPQAAYRPAASCELPNRYSTFSLSSVVYSVLGTPVYTSKGALQRHIYHTQASSHSSIYRCDDCFSGNIFIRKIKVSFSVLLMLTTVHHKAANTIEKRIIDGL